MAQVSANSTSSAADSMVDHVLDKFLRIASQSHSLPTASNTQQQPLSTFESYIKPNKLLQQDHEIRTNLAHIAIQNVPRDFKFDSLNTEQLKSILVMKAPRVIVSQDYSRMASSSTATATQPPAKRLKTSIAKSASTSNIAKDAAVPTSLASSSSSANLSSKAGAPVVSAPSSSVATVHIPMKITPSKPLPDNFYDLVKPFFNREFYEIEFDDITVNCAFFASITYNNCKDYGLELFAPDPMNFPIIHEKLAKRKYLTKDEFLTDFKTILDNIANYYPMEHPARKEVEVVREKFDSKWPVLASKFK